MKIPVVLPIVRVFVEPTGCLRVELDGEPYGADRALRREDLSKILGEITAEHQTAVRVEVAEADGTTYADIATLSPDTDPPAAVSVPSSPMPGLRGKGFEPGEEIAVAYVVLHQRADDTGAALFRLPPALLTRRKCALVLVGLTSGVMTRVRESA